MKNKVKILEVGLRDGLQNEGKHFSVNDRLFMLRKLISAGLTRIEVGSFVSPKAVPAMRQTKSFMKAIHRRLKIPKNVSLFALTPNLRGFESALESRLKHIAVFASATEAFSEKNNNCSIKENLKRIKHICTKARRHKIHVRGYLSMAFGCPYEGKISILKVRSIAKQMINEGLEELALSDTIGAASPLQIQLMLEKISSAVPISKLSLHCHNTRGMALPNIFAGLQMGIKSFDSSIGGLGGCPYAKGSSGNIATEDLAVLLQSMKLNKNIDVSKLVNLSCWLKEKKKVKLSSHIAKLSKNYSFY